MGRKTELLSTGVIGEINLTPLMDLTFILLITFIITFPLLESGLPVNLPTAEGDPLEEKETVSVAVDEEGQWFLEERALTREQFEEEIRILRATRPEATVLLRGDEGLPYGDLVRVMQVLKEGGIRKISLVTRSGGAGGGP